MTRGERPQRTRRAPSRLDTGGDTAGVDLVRVRPLTPAVGSSPCLRLVLCPWRRVGLFSSSAGYPQVACGEAARRCEDSGSACVSTNVGGVPGPVCILGVHPRRRRAKWHCPHHSSARHARNTCHCKFSLSAALSPLPHRRLGPQFCQPHGRRQNIRDEAPTHPPPARRLAF